MNHLRRARWLRTLGATWILVVAIGLQAKAEWPLKVPKGSHVLLLVPTIMWTPAGQSYGGTPIFTVNVGPKTSSEAQMDTFIYGNEFTVTKADRQHDQWVVELRDKDRTWVKLIFGKGTRVSQLFSELVTQGSILDFVDGTYFANQIAPIEAGLLGIAATTSTAAKIRCLDWAQIMQPSLQISGDEFKGRRFARIGNAAADTTEYNSIKLDQPTRVAYVFRTKDLLPLKSALSCKGTGMAGVELYHKIAFRNFVSEAADNYDLVKIYIPFDLLSRFESADITSQDLLNGSVVLVNGNRVQISLQ